jgi:phosphatidylinositol-4-phosphate 5-kinase-like protein 1
MQMRATENRRLLPDVANAVHVLDGPTNRYYLGFVDIFTPYGLRQKMGQFLKTLRFCGTDHSSASPDVYADRIQEFLEDHLT